MELQVGVKVLLKNPEGRYLIMRRSPIKYPETQKWDIPGGRIDTGSELIKNLIREVSEETGLEMTSTPKLVAAQDILKSGQEKHVVRLTYTSTAEGEPHLSEEHTEYKWVTLGDLRVLENLDRYVKTLLDEGTIS